MNSKQAASGAWTPRLAGLPRERLRTMAAAGEEILKCYRVLEKAGLNIVGEILRGQGTFYENEHYPGDDVFDADSHSQYYYHAHRGSATEHGHFHTFLRAPGMPEGVAPVPHGGTRVVKSPHPYPVLVQRLERAIAANGLGLVAQASASAGAAARGIRIPGNAVLMAFRNDYAVRMLAASVPAGIEAPLRFYVTENSDGTATLTYRTPSSLFAPYQNQALDALAKELDPVIEKIAADAVAK